MYLALVYCLLANHLWATPVPRVWLLPLLCWCVYGAVFKLDYSSRYEVWLRNCLLRLLVCDENIALFDLCLCSTRNFVQHNVSFPIVVS